MASSPTVPSRTAQTLLRFPLAACGLAGVLVAVALPPWHFLPGLFGFGLLVVAIAMAPSPANAFLRGLAFGVAFNLVGLYWIAIAFSAESDSIALLAVPATVLLCLTCGLFVAGYGLLLRLAPVRSPWTVCLGLGACWGLGEWLLGAIIGFPWNPIAIAWSASEASLQVVALTGTPALSVLTVAAAGSVAVVVLDPRPWPRMAAILAPLLLIAIIFGYGAWRLSIPLPPLSELELRVVQPDIPQRAKWDPKHLRDNFLRHIELSETAAPVQPKIVIWPESAVPFSLETDATAREYLARIAAKADGYIVTGSNHLVKSEDGNWIANNSVYVVDPKGAIVDRYDKVDLVPFGEFLPMRGLLSALGLRAVAARGDFRPGSGRTTIELPGGIPPFSPLICYEVAFPSAATDGTGRARWLLNVTNDAWFGDSAGPRQHLALARMRSVEEGLPLVRAANTGISVVTDSYGRVLAELGIGERGVIDGQLPAALENRPIGGRYGRTLGWIAIAMLALSCAIVENHRVKSSF